MVFTKSLLYLAILVVASCSLCLAHRSLPSGATCSTQFTTPEPALTIPNRKISWASYRIFGCDAPVFWLEADADEAQKLILTVGVPALERVRDVRISFAVVGPSLPALPANVEVPAVVRDSVRAGSGAVVVNVAADQTTCDHVKSHTMGSSTEVVDNRCEFCEELGGSHSWVLIDDEIQVVAVRALDWHVCVHSCMHLSTLSRGDSMRIEGWQTHTRIVVQV